MQLTRLDNYLDALQVEFSNFDRETLKSIVQYGLKRSLAFVKSGLSTRIGNKEAYLTIMRYRSTWRTKEQVKRALIAKARYKNYHLRYEPSTKWYIPIYKSREGLKELTNVRAYKLYKEAFYKSQVVLEIDYNPTFYYGWYIDIDKIQI